MKPERPASTDALLAVGPLLLISTAGPRAFVALATDARGASPRPLGARSRGRELVVAIRDLLAAAGLGVTDLGGIVVDRGPGSFTGVRVGVTTAKTLAFARTLPIVGVTSHVLLARSAAIASPHLVLRDAGRGHVYAEVVPPEATDLGTLPLWCPLAQALDEAPDVPVLVEPDSPLVAALAATDRTVRDTDVTVEAMYALGTATLLAGERLPAHRLVPAYVQKSTPEQVREGLRPA